MLFCTESVLSRIANRIIDMPSFVSFQLIILKPISELSLREHFKHFRILSEKTPYIPVTPHDCHL